MMRVLQVEDSQSDVALVADLLDEGEANGYAITAVPSLAAAREYLGSPDGMQVDIVLLDLGLPDSHGIDTLLGILEVSADIPVVVVTGLSDSEMGLAAVVAGAEDYLGKAELVAEGFLARTLQYAVNRRRRKSRSTRTGSAFELHCDEGTGLYAIDQVTTTDTAANAVHALRLRDPALFGRMVVTYTELLRTFAALQSAAADDTPATDVKADQVLAGLAHVDSAPSDLVDLHTAGLRDYAAATGLADSDAFATRAQQLLFTMMGRLAAVYRERR